MNRCTSCGERYGGTVHNCGYARVSKDRLRELEAAERRLHEGRSESCQHSQIDVQPDALQTADPERKE